jgi:penicillin amidase
VPGSPGLLLGFNLRLAWGLTALGADQADLFRLETDSTHPNQYRWNGEWRPMTVREERIAVKDGADVSLSVRETHLGPVVSAFAFRNPEEPEVALKRVPMCETNGDTIQGVFAMMRATNAAQFSQALGGWRFPTANCVYGDAEGHIGYSALGAIPIRSRRAPDAEGNAATTGVRDEDDWRGYVPASLLPQVTDPKQGLLLSANHRPVASFYGIPLGISTGSMGDTIRSWRLRERLEVKDRFSPSDVLDVHYDSVNPTRREIVRLGLHLRETKQGELSEATLKTLTTLEPWLTNGASSDLKNRGAELATSISTFFRFTATPVTLIYGGGESGLARFLKDASTRISKDAKATFSKDECKFIDDVLSAAWQQTSGQAGVSPRGRDAAPANPNRRLGWFDSLDGFGSLDPAHDLTAPELTCLDGQTIKSQVGQSYTQWVPLHDTDTAQTICPIGHSERTDSRYRTSTLTLWGEAKLHPAPLSRAAVEKLAAETKVLAR